MMVAPLAVGCHVSLFICPSLDLSLSLVFPTQQRHDKTQNRKKSIQNPINLFEFFVVSLISFFKIVYL